MRKVLASEPLPHKSREIQFRTVIDRQTGFGDEFSEAEDDTEAPAESEVQQMTPLERFQWNPGICFQAFWI